MIAQLTGTVVEVAPTYIILDVHGVGYMVSVTHGSGYILGDSISIHTYLAVRENALDLYGFNTRTALTMFEHLLKLPKVGPKTALQILSQADLAILTKAISTHDPEYLSKMSSISRKNAEKIVTGLKDVFDGTHFADIETHTHQTDTDVIDALVALGYTQKDAITAIQKIPSDITDTNMRIRHALKYIS